jgi:transposase
VIPRPSREQLRVLISENPEAVIDLIEMLFDKIDDLTNRFQKLEERLSLNSGNSSKPPSTDGFRKPRKSSQRKNTGKKPGGQKGHIFHTLEFSSEPDDQVLHTVEKCACGHYFSENEKSITSRQIFDIPELKIFITQLDFEVGTCPCCQKETFNEQLNNFKRRTQYGFRIKSLVTYLMQYQFIPYNRMKDFLNDIFAVKVSAGSFFNWMREASGKLSVFEEELKQKLLQKDVLHFDETGCNINGKLHWLHSSDLTLLAVHENRGAKAMSDIDILPHYTGIGVHDFWKPYYKFKMKHSLCNAHNLRDLKFLQEELNENWAGKVISFLIKVKRAKEKEISKGRWKFTKKIIADFNLEYRHIVKIAQKCHPENMQKNKSRGRPKRTKQQNFIKKLKEKADEILHFMNDFDVPFDNNQAERDIRMEKVHMKISGCFRSIQGAQFSFRIRSLISTVRKNGNSINDALNNLFSDKKILILTE